MNKRRWFIWCFYSMLIFTLVGCGNEEASKDTPVSQEPVGSEEKPVEPISPEDSEMDDESIKESKEDIEETPDESEKANDEVQGIVVQNQETTLYESEEGSIVYQGKNSSMDGDYYVFIVSGGLKHTDKNPKTFNFIYPTGDTVEIGERNLSFIHPIDKNKEVQFYTDDESMDEFPMRVDFKAWPKNPEKASLEEDQVSIESKEISEPAEEVTVPLATTIENFTETLEISKETINSTVNLSGIKLFHDEITVRGTLDYKEDSEDEPMFSYYLPTDDSYDSWSISGIERQQYKGTSIPFEETITMDDFKLTQYNPVIHFNVAGALFSFNLSTRQLEEQAKPFGEYLMAKRFTKIDGWETNDGEFLYEGYFHDYFCCNNDITSDTVKRNFTKEKLYLGTSYNTLSFDVYVGNTEQSEDVSYLLRFYDGDPEGNSWETTTKPLYEARIQRDDEKTSHSLDVSQLSSDFITMVLTEDAESPEVELDTEEFGVYFTNIMVQ